MCVCCVLICMFIYAYFVYVCGVVMYVRVYVCMFVYVVVIYKCVNGMCMYVNIHVYAFDVYVMYV